ncbi:alpha/beta hydrolase family protein [Polaribacter tangerinus]|uniref:alpha/beta hydrolase family protein n=1 Tax=Polaribacter tangerinus TaxID=1920034 RepID=UPI0018E953C2|nr:alpha/beta fold hydrolase [Polaribacter tangerinus]
MDIKRTQNFTISGKHQKPIVADVFYTANKTPKKIVVFCHGYKGFKDWGAWNLMAETFAKSGFFFVKFNFSHNGGTVNNPIDFPDLEAFGNNNYTKELDDLETVLDWLFTQKTYQKEVNTSQICLIGHSRGGGIVTIKAAEDNRIKNLISLAGVCDFEKRTSTVGDLEDWKKNGVKYVVNGRTKQHMPHYYQFYEDFIANKNRLDIKKATQKISVPHLIIHGNKDTAVLIDEAKKLHKWNPKSSLEIIDDANHVFNVSHPWKQEKTSVELEKVTNLCINFLS